MISKKIIVLCLLIVAVGGLVMYANNYANSEKLPVASAKDAPATDAMPAAAFPIAGGSPAAAPIPPANLSYDTKSFKAAALPERLTAMSLRRQGRAFNPEEVAAALRSDLAWESSPSIADKLPVALSKEERKDGREFVQANPMKIEALMQGDEMSLPVKQIKADAPVRMVVDSVEEAPGGNVTWHGHLKDYGSENQVTFTRGDGKQGESLIVGGINTPDKNYVVQIYGNVGWVVEGFTIFKGRHDAIKPDQNGGGATTQHSHDN